MILISLTISIAGPTKVGQYVVSTKNVVFDKEAKRNDQGKAGSALVIQIEFSRRISNILLVTYLPTILMNIINQASNYITGDTKYDLIYTVNM